MSSQYFILLQTIFLTLAYAQKDQPSYTDYLIVGAGTSGCILATRLCQAFPYRHVTLLERGLPRSTKSDFLVRAPRKLYDTWSDRNVTQGYSSLPDPGINNRTTAVLTGITLGGTSAIAGVQWQTPLPGSAEKWGITGLDTNTANVYFRKAFDGMEFAPPQVPLQYADDYVEAAKRAGFSSVTDPVRQPFKYIWQNRLSINSQFRRNTPCSQFLDPALTSPCQFNLDVVQGVTASRILLNKNYDGMYNADGVETISTLDKTTKRHFYARKEVILAAGPYGSVQLLQLSGIGSVNTLNAAGVRQKINLPVGENTVNRASANVRSTYNGVPDEPANNLDLVNSPEQRAIWDAGNGGLLATPVTACNGRAGNDGYFTSFLIPFLPGSPELRTACQQNTVNTGFVRIRDSNPFSDLLVNYNLLANQSEIEPLMNCLKAVVEIHRQFPSNFNMTFTHPPDGIISEEYVRSIANTGGHLVSGCPVGNVLTGELKVKGANKLRVIDASSLRALPVSSGPLSAVLMLAEFMADQLVKG